MADEFTKAALYGIKTFNKKVKEKIGMMKLINLLNEYETPISGVVYKSYDDYDGFFYGVDCDGETEIAWSDSLICSKKFGFIKWLVDNDKIDFYTILKENGTFRKEFYAIENRKEYERLIMLLSVEDEPINFLISMLK